MATADFEGDTPTPAWWRSVTIWMVFAMVLVAAVGTILSYAGIRSWGLSSGYPDVLASLLPIAVDGLVLAGVLQVVHACRNSTSAKYGWFLTIIGAAASVAANVMTAPGFIAAVSADQITAPIVMTAFAHGLPPVAVLLVLEAGQNISRQNMKKKLADGKAETITREALLEQELAEVRSASSDAVAIAQAAQGEAERELRALEQNHAVVHAGGAVASTRPRAGNGTQLGGKKQGHTQEVKNRAAYLRHVKGMTVAQVAAETGVSHASVKRYAKQSTAA
jgi:hypothetical protein